MNGLAATNLMDLILEVVVRELMVRVPRFNHSESPLVTDHFACRFD